jgi:hypothetical protein
MNPMKRLAFCAALLVCAIGLSAQTPEWLWATGAGGTDDDLGTAIATDSQGNQYVTGTFMGTAAFGATSLTSRGTTDIFITKLDSDGNFLWAVQAGGTGEDGSHGISVDTSANVYITGYFQGSASFGSTSLTSAGNYDIFATKLDSNGSFLWAAAAGGTSFDQGYGIAVDASGNVYLTGYFRQDATFGFTTLSNNGNSDIFAAKLDSDGNFLWAVSAGGTGYDQGSAISVNDANVYLTGSFNSSTIVFGSTTLTSSGYYDVFVAKLNTAGNWLWAKSAGGSNTDVAFSIALDASANVCLAGYFESATAYFGSIIITGSGNLDVFAAKLDTNGNFLWAKQAGGTGEDWGNSIAVDAASNLYLTGWFAGSAVFGTATLTSSNYDVFAAKLDANGNFLWVKQAGGTGEDRGYGIAVDAAANAYVTGEFEGSAVFGSATLISSGSIDIFVAKISPGVPVDDDLAPEISALSRMSDAYPNPFCQGGTSIIKANIADRDSGTLSVFNLRGQCVSTKQLSSGEQQITLDSQNLTSGIYLYQLKTQTANITKKLLLLK